MICGRSFISSYVLRTVPYYLSIYANTKHLDDPPRKHWSGFRAESKDTLLKLYVCTIDYVKFKWYSTVYLRLLIGVLRIWYSFFLLPPVIAWGISCPIMLNPCSHLYWFDRWRCLVLSFSFVSGELFIFWREKRRQKKKRKQSRGCAVWIGVLASSPWLSLPLSLFFSIFLFLFLGEKKQLSVCCDFFCFCFVWIKDKWSSKSYSQSQGNFQFGAALRLW